MLTLTRAPLEARHLIWLFLSPTSTATMVTSPPSLNTRGSLVETAATKLSLFGSSKGMESGGVSPTMILPSMLPLDRSFCVSARVSTPVMPGMFCDASHWDSDCAACQWLEERGQGGGRERESV